MGLFDSVYFDCPNCNTEKSLEFQSKAGDCVLQDYDPAEVPTTIAADINGDVSYCRNCNASFRAIAFVPKTSTVEIIENK